MAEEPSFSGEAIAAAWERHRTRLFEGQRELSEWIVRHLEPRPGQTILELTSGPGETGFLVAERIGPDGRLISSDLNPGMVAAARRGAEARGLTNVEFRVIDAANIDLPDASVDGVLSRFGLMLVPEREAAFAECRRVVRDGGRLSYGVWGPFDRNPWLTQLVGALLQHGHTPGGDPGGPGGVFSLATPEINRHVLEEAGFTDVEVEEVPGAQHYVSVNEYWDVQTEIAGPMSGIVRSLDADGQAAIKSTLTQMVEPYLVAGGGLELPSLALGVSARAA
ncbi:MAG: methyltransferase domain-containing protein [Acidimicrobiia bacterium]|nr:methyltransferase domain-containing protein [Acidimicrobiia bacterium]